MINQQFPAPISLIHPIHLGVKERSDLVINYFLVTYFLLGLVFAQFYGTWLIAIGVGGFSLTAYYSVKLIFPNSCLYQYVLSIILGLFMAQFIYQMQGMFEMHFFAFIGSAILITYQKWKLQLPMLMLVMTHYGMLILFQNAGFSKFNFSQLEYYTVETFIIHILLTAIIYFICGFCAFELHKYHRIQLIQTAQMTLLHQQSQRTKDLKKDTDALKQRNAILESIGDAFFAVDKNWIVTYWNQTAEKILQVLKKDIIAHNLWEIFPGSVGLKSYHLYHQSLFSNENIIFEDFFEPLEKWFEISVYPSANGLSVYLIDITERKNHNAELKESEKRYSNMFHFSPMPMWILDLDSLRFIDVNDATIAHYGYTREEFLSMTLRDIRPASELANMEKGLEQGRNEPGIVGHRQMIHQKKNGDHINMDLQLAAFPSEGLQRVSIVIGTDVTEMLSYVKAIEEQNEKLISISWMQSHIIRAPLARIIGLLPLLQDPVTNLAEKEQINFYLTQSANELDEALKSLSIKTQMVTPNSVEVNQWITMNRRS